MAQSVVIKKEEKVECIFSSLGKECTYEEFSKKFKEDYAKDWERIQKRYLEHEKKDIKGKGHPMPAPNQYLKKMFNNGKKKHIDM